MKKPSFLIFLLILLSACTSETTETGAEHIVKEYYTSLNNKDYSAMYSLISEGFKQIEPTAKDLTTFQQEMSKFFDAATSIMVTSTSIRSETPTEVVVDYVALITLKSGTQQELKSGFTVKKKPEGWRLIHPYGKNIDTS